MVDFAKPNRAVPPALAVPPELKKPFADPPELEKGWAEVEAPKQIQFDRPGLEVAGRLLAVSWIRLDNKQVRSYVMTIDGKAKFKFLGTYDLVQKLGPEHVGAVVRIKYLGEDPGISRDGKHMKLFHVSVKSETLRPLDQAGAVPISDEDIPF